MTEDSDIGACALLAGISTTAQAYHLTNVQVTAALLCLHPDTSPFLKQIRLLMVTQAQTYGVSTAARNFGVSEEVIKVLCGEAGAPSSPDSAGKPEIPSPEIKETPTKPARKQPANDLVDLTNGDSLLTQMKRKVRQMYDSKVKIKVIASLFGIPNDLVHSWGDFSRCRDKEKMMLQRATLQDKLDQGFTLNKAAKEMKMPVSAAESVLGLCSDLEMSRSISPEQRLEALRLAKTSPRLASVVKKLKISKGCLRRWLKDDFTFDGGDSKYVQGDSSASAAKKRRCLEEFYLSDDVTKAASVTDLSPDQAQQIITDFEMKISQKRTREVNEGAEEDQVMSEQC